MPQLTTPSTSKTVAESRSKRSGILIGGTLVVLVASGISMQVWRAQATQAAEQKADGAADSAGTDAQNTAFARVNAEPISYEALAKECVERHGKEVLENMISRTIIQQACAERGIVAIASLVAADRRRLLAAPRVGAVGLRLFELLPLMPRFTIEQVRQKLATTFPTATAAVKLLEELGIVTELTGQKKNRCFSYAAYVDLLAGDTR